VGLHPSNSVTFGIAAPIFCADAFVVALAQQMEAMILTGDPEFGKIEPPGRG